MEGNLTNIYLYTRYERFWHWLQMVFIAILLITGFEVHGLFTWLGFETAVTVHNTVGLTWLIAFAFFVFWMFTTGEWKQYVPTTRKMISVVRYYSWGIFQGESHPVPKRKEAKHNPLQRLVYLSLAAFLLPFQMITGFLILGIQPLAGLGARIPVPQMDRDPAHVRRHQYSDLYRGACLHDHHRPQPFGPRKSHDYRLGRCRGGGENRGVGESGKNLIRH